MDYILIALLVAVGVLVALNRRNADAKIRRVLAQLKDSSQDLPEVVARLEALENRIQDLDPEPVRQELARIRTSLDHLLEAPPAPELPVEVEDELPRPLEVRRLLERVARARGMEQLRILSSDEELDEDELHVRVEALQNGLVIKGLVHVVGTEVREAQLEDSRQQFP